MEFIDDPKIKAKYICQKCRCPVFRAIEDGKRIFVHRTMNGYADHAKHCPRRRPDKNLINKDNN